MAKIIIFIHGIGSNSNTWNTFIDTLSSDNETKHCKKYTPNVTKVEQNTTYYLLYEYESKITKQPKLIEYTKEKITGIRDAGDITLNTLSKTFKSELEQISTNFDNINIVAHSMGGIILMNTLFNIVEHNNNLAQKINRCILYGSPLYGSKEPNELKKLLKLDISTNILNELKADSNTIIMLKQQIEKNSSKIKENFQIMYIAGDRDSRIIDVDESIIKKFGVFKQVQGGHSEIIQPSISSSSFIFFKTFLFDNKSTTLVAKQNDLNFTLNSNYLNRINDLGIKLTHPNKNDIKLEDIFIFPDLQDLENHKKVKISSEKILDRNNYKKCLIFGDEVSGKTSLALYAQEKLNKEDYIPIYFDAKNIKKPDIKTFMNRLYLNLRNQYFEIKRDELEDFVKEYGKKIVIIIDNIDNLAIKNHETKSLFFSTIDQHFEHIILLSNDSFEMEVMTKEHLKEKFDDFKIFKIKEFGYKLRDKLINKWIHIGDTDLNENELFEKKDEITRIIETLIGNKFIPTYPLYLISLLQQIEAGTSNNLGGSAYAEFYNYLINQALGTTKIKPDELDFYHSYLAYIAFYYFENHRKQLDRNEIEKVHEKFSIEIHKAPFDVVMENLLTAKLIKLENNNYSFMHNYIYYFFVAKYLSDNLGKKRKQADMEKIIDNLIERLYRPQFANIIIFLIHHSKSSAENIIDKIIQEAKKLFDDIKPSTLSKDELININNLINQEIELVMEDKNPHEYRDEQLEIKDKIEEVSNSSIDDTESEEDEVIKYNEEIPKLDTFSKLNLSMKVIEILGQITKNYYGSLTQIEKVEILEELAHLGLRNLSWFLEQFQEFQELLEHEIKKKIKNKKITTNEEIERITKRIIFDFAEMISIAFIKKISTSIASKNLFLTINTLVENDNNEATKLIEIATKLEFSSELNTDIIFKLNQEFKNNFIAQNILKYLVINHLYKFDVKYSKKQKICKKLNIGVNNQKNILVKQAAK